MNVEELGRHKLKISDSAFDVECPRGNRKFSGLAVSRLPKIYVASADGLPIYVGVTRQPIRNRLRLGWKAKGETGYYGYPWRKHFQEVELNIWCHLDPPAENPCLDVETVEAEVVFMIRAAGQWPPFQTEIHFHPSTEVHRSVARAIVTTYDIK